MKKKLYILSTILLSAAVLSLSSCLKDPRLIDFTKVGTVVDFPLGGLNYFGADAITAAPAADANGTIVTQFSVNIASPNPPTTAINVTLAIDNTIINTYNANSSVQYVPMPANTFSFTSTTASIPAGQRTAIVSVTFYKNLLDPSLSYMLPIKIVSASDGATVSGNLGVHYFHFIGNPFAGSYTQSFYRYNNQAGTGAPAGGSFFGANANTTQTISPVTPTNFEMPSGYYVGTEKYEVNFNIVSPGNFNNWTIAFNAGDVANIFTANGITVVQQPIMGFGVAPAFDGTQTYTYASALPYFSFQYVVQNSSGFRFCNDVYVHN